MAGRALGWRSGLGLRQGRDSVAQLRPTMTLPLLVLRLRLTPSLSLSNLLAVFMFCGGWGTGTIRRFFREQAVGFIFFRGRCCVHTCSDSLRAPHRSVAVGQKPQATSMSNMGHGEMQGSSEYRSVCVAIPTISKLGRKRRSKGQSSIRLRWRKASHYTCLNILQSNRVQRLK